MFATASVIFTTKNRREDLQRAICSALGQDHPVEIIVMDDGSTDGTTDMVCSTFPTVEVHRFTESAGSIIRRNDGARRASGDILFLIDDDSEFSSPSVVRQVIANFDHPRIGAVAIPYIDVRRDDSIRHKAPDHEYTWVASTYTGAACAVRRDVFMCLGGYRELLYHGVEERDYSIRMLDLGYVVRLGNSDVVHHHISPLRSNTWIRSIERRNNLIFALCNVPQPEVFLHLAGTIATGMRFAVRHHLIWPTLKGYASLVPMLRNVLRERNPVRRSVYHLSRRLDRERACRLSEIERHLSPLVPTQAVGPAPTRSEPPVPGRKHGGGLGCGCLPEVPPRPRVLVMQKGSREHYLVARALHRRRMLAGLIVDWYAPESRFVAKLFASLGGNHGRAALAAQAPDLPRNLVITNRRSALFSKWIQGMIPFVRRGYFRALIADIAFSKAAAKCIAAPHEVFFGYSYMSLEALEVAKAKGVLTILDQIDPGPAHFRIVADEMRRHSHLCGLPQPFPEAYFERLRREWALADVILANSEWTREALVAEGVDARKIEVVPLAYEMEVPAIGAAQTQKAGPLRVLWLGQVTPGKGIHYLMEAARLLQDENVRIDVVGPIGIRPKAVAAAPPNMTFHGRVNRVGAADWYRQSDVFVLSTLSDGFALTQLEAMAHGLPVIATPNCGRVVEEGKTGFIVPARDAQALAAAILRFVRDPALAPAMRPHCLEAVGSFSIDAYGQRLVAIIQAQSRALGGPLLRSRGDVVPEHGPGGMQNVG